MTTKRKRTSERNMDRSHTAGYARADSRAYAGSSAPTSQRRNGATQSTGRGTSAGARAEVPGRGTSAGASGRGRGADGGRGGDGGRRRPSAVRRKRRWPLVLLLVVVLLAAAAVVAFSWDRWLRFDDAADLQGEWRPQGSTAVFVINGEAIKLTSDVAYSYTLDTGAKTIAYTFGTMTGQGRYRFSPDRSQLVITDGDSFTWLTTLADDIGRMADQVQRAVQGQPQEETAAGEGVTVLDRLSRNAAAEPQEGSAVASGAVGTGGSAGADGSAGASGSADAAGGKDADAGGGKDADAGDAADAGAGAADGALNVSDRAA